MDLYIKGCRVTVGSEGTAEEQMRNTLLSQFRVHSTLRPVTPDPDPRTREHIIEVAGTTARQLLTDIVQYGGYAHSFFGEPTLVHGIRKEGNTFYVSQYEHGPQTPMWDVMSARRTGEDRYAIQFLERVNWPKGKSLRRFVEYKRTEAQQAKRAAG